MKTKKVPSEIVSTAPRKVSLISAAVELKATGPNRECYVPVIVVSSDEKI